MKQVIDPELANFVFNYLVLKANVYKRMLKDILEIAKEDR